MAKKKRYPSGTPYPVRISDAQMARLTEAARLLNMPIQEVVRLAADIGLTTLEKIDYDLARTIVDAVDKPVGRGDDSGVGGIHGGR